MRNEVELVADIRAVLGEGPHWDHVRGHLYWTDILSKKLFIFDPATGQIRSHQFDQYIGAVVTDQSGNLWMAMQHGFHVYDVEKGTLTPIADPEAHLPDNRFNDGKCDIKGRFWAGTMQMEGKEGRGSLYCLDTEQKVRRKLSNVSISNGLAWNPDGRFMYFIDTPTRQVAIYEYDMESGEISYMKTGVRIPEGAGYPDGMTIDREGMIWVAHWGGSRVSRWDPHRGKCLSEIHLPAPNVTSCVFGGEDLDELYITTAREGLSREELERYPQSGGLFKAKTNVTGEISHPYGCC